MKTPPRAGRASLSQEPVVSAGPQVSIETRERHCDPGSCIARGRSISKQSPQPRSSWKWEYNPEASAGSGVAAFCCDTQAGWLAVGGRRPHASRWAAWSPITEGMHVHLSMCRGIWVLVQVDRDSPLLVNTGNDKNDSFRERDGAPDEGLSSLCCCCCCIRLDRCTMRWEIAPLAHPHDVVPLALLVLTCEPVPDPQHRYLWTSEGTNIPHAPIAIASTDTQVMTQQINLQTNLELHICHSCCMVKVCNSLSRFETRKEKIVSTTLESDVKSTLQQAQCVRLHSSLAIASRESSRNMSPCRGPGDCGAVRDLGRCPLYGSAPSRL